MILSLLPEGDEFLKTTCQEFDFKCDLTDTFELSSNMLETMYDAKGVGLACPQVGLSYRMFVLGVDGVEMICYNPKIIKEYGELKTFEEGCLSYPDLFMKVKRVGTITVQYHDEKGEIHEHDLDGIWARCFLHELDHLNGLVFLDRVGRTTLQMAKKRRHKQRRNSK
jgi:peptide deformylase